MNTTRTSSGRIKRRNKNNVDVKHIDTKYNADVHSTLTLLSKYRYNVSKYKSLKTHINARQTNGRKLRTVKTKAQKHTIRNVKKHHHQEV